MPTTEPTYYPATGFGRKFEQPLAAYCGYRAIHDPSYSGIDVVPDRTSGEGPAELRTALIAWANTGPWKRLCRWARSVPGSSCDIFREEDPARGFVLEASPQCSFGYIYIGLAKLA